MPLPGLMPQNIRLPGLSEARLPDVAIDESDTLQEPAGEEPILRIEHDDGSVTISMNGQSLVDSPDKKPGNWFDNLVDDIDQGSLGAIADDLLRGIGDDLESRKEWIEARAQGLKLLGLKIEMPGIAGGADGAPVEGMSRVRHPLLLEAVLRFQANARSELLRNSTARTASLFSHSASRFRSAAGAAVCVRARTHAYLVTAYTTFCVGKPAARWVGQRSAGRSRG
jgi:hypothetical protein